MSRRLALLALLLPCAAAIPRADETALLRVEVRDGSGGRPARARFYLTGEDGQPRTPAGFPKYDRGQEHHFIAPGSFETRLEPGTYTIAAERGTEYVPDSATVRLGAGENRSVELRVDRWIDMNRLGWYSGDLHNHRAADDMAQLLVAEELNFAPTLIDWVWADAQRASAPSVSRAIVEIDPKHAYSLLDKEVERLETGPGAVDLIGLTSPVPFDGYRLHPPNTVYCRAARAQGAYVDAEKIVWRDGAALAALGLIDFAGIVHNHFNRHGVELETDRWGMIPKSRPEYNTPSGMPLWSMEVYYRLLNCGFRIAASGGSASGVKAAPLGYSRTYVKLDGPFSYRSWLRALKSGRSFATNGPMLFLTAAGRGPGSRLRARAGDRIRVRAEARSLRELDRIEILFRGRVVASASRSDVSRTLIASAEVPIEESGWFAARAFDRPDRTVRFAQTSPVYVEIPGRPGRAAEDARFFLEWIDREIAFYRREPGFRAPEHRDAMLSFFREARAVYERLARN